MNMNLTLLGQMITFAMLVWVTMKYVWPPITKAMEERQAKIADGLAAAERGKHEQELAERRSKELLKEAKGDAAEIIAQAQKRSNEIIEEAKEAARAEGDRILTAAKAEIEQEANRAREQLRAQVVTLAVAGAGRILKREIDAKAHDDLLKDVIKQL